MARPSKYNWSAIEKAYKGGAEVKDICKKYNVSKKTLQNKISEFRWEITGTLNADISEFKEVLGKVTQNAQNNPETTDIYADKIITILEDNKLIQNNRKLASALQGIMGQEIKSGKINANNIKSMTGALKDIESIANPNLNSTQVNVQNNVQESHEEHITIRIKE